MNKFQFGGRVQVRLGDNIRRGFEISVLPVTWYERRTRRALILYVEGFLALRL